MPAVRSRFVVRTVATLLWFTLLAGQFWRNLLDWWGWGAIAIALIVASAITLVRFKPDWRWRRFPKALLFFLGLATLSITWSAYPGASAIGIALQWLTSVTAFFLALTLSWAEMLRTLSLALRWLLGLSLVFELFVAVFVGHEVLPFWVDYGPGPIPEAFYWSRGLLLQGGPIEGIVASRNLLGFAALLAVIVFAVQLAARTVKRGWGVAWLVIAVATLALTRSATVTVAGVAVVLALLFALWARRVDGAKRRPLYLTAFAALVAVVGSFIAFMPTFLDLFGKSPDLTGRFDIWESVIALSSDRPLWGWGWVSYWVPWVEPFNGLAVRNGVTYLQAHNAWLDVWLQLGIVGLVVFGSLVLSAIWRSWFLAVDRPRRGLADTEPHTASALLPLLLMAALIAQSVAESRMLVEFGWVLLVVLAVMTKRQQATAAQMP